MTAEPTNRLDHLGGLTGHHDRTIELPTTLHDTYGEPARRRLCQGGP